MNPTRTLKRVLACAALCASTAGFADIVITSEIRMATNPSPYIVQFLDEVAKRTNGELKGKYFAASQLYNDRDAIGAIGTGADQGRTSNVNTSGLVARLLSGDLPSIDKDRGDADDEAPPEAADGPPPV